MKRDFRVCTDCRTKVLAQPHSRPPRPTASPLSTPTLTAPASQMSSNNQQATTGNQKGSNYFFGILFSVAILILMCATCGIGSRARYFVRRNRNVQREVEARGEWKEEENAPRLHEVGFVNNAQGDVRWADVMPLSVSYLSDTLDNPTKHTRESSEDLRPPSSITPRSTRSRNRVERNNKTKTKNVSASEDMEQQQPTEIRTLILIVMPSFHRDRRLGVDADADDHQLIIKHPTTSAKTISSEIHIGVETMPWDTR